MPPRSYIAIVDDDESLCRSLSRLLQLSGLHTIYFLSAEEFLADRLCDQFGCLLVDVQLPGMSGTELHRQLRARGLNTPVIYLTAYDDSATKEEALSTGCAGFFRKTSPGTDIIAAVRRVLSTPKRTS